ncbi:MAG: hypothetical protein CL912_01710 [Deltaproteobacteria bacterium]|nr:hypothetical protein [Deltaproteobacteria bacterium]
MAGYVSGSVQAKGRIILCLEATGRIILGEERLSGSSEVEKEAQQSRKFGLVFILDWRRCCVSKRRAAPLTVTLEVAWKVVIHNRQKQARRSDQ